MLAVVLHASEVLFFTLPIVDVENTGILCRWSSGAATQHHREMVDPKAIMHARSFPIKSSSQFWETASIRGLMAHSKRHTHNPGMYISLLAMFQCPTSLDDVPQRDCESLLYRLCCLCSISIFRTPNLWTSLASEWGNILSPLYCRGTNECSEGT